jgi:uncharacterized protein YbaA (DUF1428 family)
MSYIDGFLVPCPADRIDDYRAIAITAFQVWLEHGALEYWECVAEDLRNDFSRPFPEVIGAGDGETVVFAWIRYRSRAHRDEVNALVMKDPRIADMPPESMPFDCKRMAYGGFEVVVGGRADA